MRKTRLYIALVFAVLFSFKLNGQFLLDVNAGVINSTVKFENVPSIFPSDITNLYISVSPGYKYDPRLEFKSEFQFNTKGYTMQTGEEIFDATVYNYRYINMIPQVHFRPIPLVGISAGPSFGLKLSEKARDAGINPGPWTKTQTIKSTDFGYQVNVLLHYRNFYLKLAYDKGAANILDTVISDENGVPFTNAKQSNRAFQFGIGYYIFG